MVSFITAAWYLGMKEEAKWQLDELLLSHTFTDSKVIISRLPWHKSSKKPLKRPFEKIEVGTN
tara:strand:+ start:349 stop:537 length:189 start_codon:yes stop_codon:yes gene_type:complete